MQYFKLLNLLTHSRIIQTSFGFKSLSFTRCIGIIFRLILLHVVKPISALTINYYCNILTYL
jgi:hypothetical protein